MYRTTNGGESWVRRTRAGSNFTGAFGGFGWYFGDVAVDQVAPDRVFELGVSLFACEDGGATFTDVTGNAHVDEHALWIDPTVTNRIYMGSDGGFYWTTSGGGLWNKSTDLPITQFYAGTVDPSNPQRLLGGAQDNFTLITAGSPSGWHSILGGDGFQCVVDPTDPNVIFAEWQWCCDRSGPRKSTDGGGSFSGSSGFLQADRYNWNTPIVMDPLNHNIVLVGSHRVYKSTDNGIIYAPTSADLTRGDTGTQLVYHTLSTLDISSADNSVYWAGSDDGRVHVSTDAGGNWTDVTAGLPLRWVTRVLADPAVREVAYVTLSGFGADEHLAHVYRTGDLGATWIPIAGNLPDVPANDIVVDPGDPNRLFLATDVGVYATYNLGTWWYPLGTGLPIQAVFDLTFHSPTRTLIAATHGRSQWRLGPISLVVGVGETQVSRAIAFSPLWPNPARGEIHGRVTLPTDESVRIDVFDVRGRHVRRLLDRRLTEGTHSFAWDGKDRLGRATARGTYFLRLQVGGRMMGKRQVVRL